MGRLIDADKLYDDLADKLKWLMGYGDDVYLSVGDDIRCAVANQPTAYDLDKVAEQLEKEFKKYYGENYNKAPYLIRAIEIVKGEYATEQSCEWKLEDSESNLYVTGCKNRQLIFEGTPEENGYKYCPYCGSKIKRGGADAEH